MSNKKKSPKSLYSYNAYSNLFIYPPLTSDRANELNFRPVYLENNTLYYKYRFPILFWERKDKTKVPTLFCKLSINTTNNSVRIDAVKPSGESYAYFYCTEVTVNNKDSHSMLISIHQNIQNKLRKLNIKPIIERKKYKKGDTDSANRTRVQKPRKPKMENNISIKRIPRTPKCNQNTEKRRRIRRKILQD